MEKKSWKKKLLTNLIVFLVVLVIFALSFLTADNQRKQWIEDYGDEAGNFTQTYLTKGYIPEAPEARNNKVGTVKDIPNKSVITQNEDLIEGSIEISVEISVEKSSQAAGDFTVEKPSDASEVIKEEPSVLHSSAVSPDSKYIAETYGENKNITAAGMYPSREIRIRELITDQILWSMTGSYECTFLWTQDSRYLAVSYTGRTYSETVIVDTKDFTEVMVPIPEQVEEKMHESRPDIYLYAEEWEEDGRLLIDFTYTGKDSTEYSGSFIYDLLTGTISAYQMNDSITS